MPRFLRVKNQMIHVPSLSSVSMQSNCFGRPYLALYFHTKDMMKIQFAEWNDCEADFNRLKTALTEIEALLQKVALTEEPPKIILETDTQPRQTEVVAVTVTDNQT